MINLHIFLEGPRAKHLPVLCFNAAILALWFWLFRPVYPYLATLFTRQEFRTNQIVLLVVLVLIGLQARRGQLRISLSHLPQLHPIGLVFALGGATGFIAAERWLDINTLSATLLAWHPMDCWGCGWNRPAGGRDSRLLCCW